MWNYIIVALLAVLIVLLIVVIAQLSALRRKQDDTAIQQQMDKLQREMQEEMRQSRKESNEATQQAVQPPTFVMFVNDQTLMHFSYERYLEKQFRKAFGFEGTPLRFILRERQKEN